MMQQVTVKKKKIRYRSRELLTLALFSLLAALLSLVVMDVIVFPISLLAIYQTDLFNTAIQYLLVLIITVILLYPLVKKVISLKINGLGAGQIIMYLIKRVSYYMSIFCIFILISCFLAGLLYFFMYNNHLILHRILNII